LPRYLAQGEVMLVTIIADASHCPETKACGWAYWIASQRGKRGGDGYEATPIVNSIAAEMLALLHGVLQGCGAGLVHPKDTLLLQTDCQAAIDAFEGKRKRITKEELKIVIDYLKLVKSLQLIVEFRHVPGHTQGETARTWTNNKCDALAGIAMRKAQRKFRQTKPVLDQGPPWD
jgi:ribonuclease HI